jgi:hypothetical protein
MERSRFVAVAPLYYALAIGKELVLAAQRGQWVTISAVKSALSEGSVYDDYYCYVEHDVLIEQAIAWLTSHEIIDVITDEFAPHLYRCSSSFDSKWEQLSEDQSSVFFKHSIVPDATNWLLSALGNVNKKYNELEITASDFEPMGIDEWEPLPLDRADPALQNTIAAVEEAIEQIRSDNGYSSTFPKERAYVLDKLSSFSRRLKTEATISFMYIKEFGIVPLGRVIGRFGAAAVGLAAVAARDTLLQCDLSRPRGRIAKTPRLSANMMTVRPGFSSTTTRSRSSARIISRRASDVSSLAAAVADMIHVWP